MMLFQLRVVDDDDVVPALLLMMLLFQLRAIDVDVSASC
jgi:hypothetical protein